MIRLLAQMYSVKLGVVFLAIFVAFGMFALFVNPFLQEGIPGKLIHSLTGFFLYALLAWFVLQLLAVYAKEHVEKTTASPNGEQGISAYRNPDYERYS